MLSTILLECTMAGMATCTLTHLIESSDSRDIVRGLTRQRGEPQALIRVGIAPPLAAVPAPHHGGRWTASCRFARRPRKGVMPQIEMPVKRVGSARLDQDAFVDVG